MSCCKKFEEVTGKFMSVGPSALAYPPNSSEAQIECDDEGKWNVYGCCGGQCYVLEDLKYCPWCGTELPPGNLKTMEDVIERMAKA